jgi:hypothetical protein
MKHYLDSVVQASTGWLSAKSHGAQLGAQGYDSEGVLGCLQKAAVVSDKVHSDRSASSAARQAAISQLQEQLRAVGRALTTFAHPSACNSQACMCFAGPSEASLVKRNSGRCSSCKAAKYCLKSCQRAAWKQHKPVCKGAHSCCSSTYAGGHA